MYLYFITECKVREKCLENSKIVWYFALLFVILQLNWVKLEHKLKIDMNKDTIIGFVLIAVVLIGFSWWNQPSAEQIEAARIQDSIAAVQQEQATKAAKAATLASQLRCGRKP